MSDQLKKQLRDYGTFLDENRTAVDLTTLQEGGAVEQPVRSSDVRVSETIGPWPEFEAEADDSRPSLWDVLLRPRVLAALGSVAAVATAIGLVVILSSADTDPPPRAEGASERGVGQPAAEGEPVVPVEVSSAFPGMWLRVDVPGAPPVRGRAPEVMTSVAAGGPGLVAVGFDFAGEDGPDALAWTSVDGLSWSRAQGGAESDGSVLADAQMFDVVAAGPGLAAVGEAHGAAAVWTSVDGEVWSRGTVDGSVPDQSGRTTRASPFMLGVAVGGPGLVAVGYDRGDTAVWTSADGVSWSRVTGDDAVFPGKMYDVTAGGPGLVAVGRAHPLGANREPAVWTSADGVSWSRSSLGSADDLLETDDFVAVSRVVPSMLAVTAGGPGLVAVGTDNVNELDPKNAVVWTSVDGLSWSRVPHDEVFDNARMHDVIATEQGLLAVGGNPEGAEAWTSGDGRAWSRLPIGDAVGFWAWGDPLWGVPVGAITSLGDALVAVGLADGGPAAWTTATPPTSP